MTDLEQLKSFAPLVSAVEDHRSKSPLKIGWRINAVLDEVLEQESKQPDPPAKRVVYGATLDQLAEYFAGTSDWDNPEAARAKLVDYARVARVFPKSRYENLDGAPKFSQLRACLTKSSSWWEYNTDEIEARVAWSEDNGWPSTANIKEHFSTKYDEELSEDDKRWDAFDKARQVAYDKAAAYLDATSDKSSDPVILERRKQARKILEAN